MSPRKRGGPRALVPQLVPMDKLRPDPANLNTHPERNIEAIAESLDEFGQVKPIVVSKDFIIAAGNGTYEGAGRLGWTELGAIVYPGSLAQAKRYAIADNRSAELAEWDWPALAETLHDAEAAGKLPGLGFTPDEVVAVDQILARGEGTPVSFVAHPKDAEAPAHKCPECGHEFDD